MILQINYKKNMYDSKLIKTITDTSQNKTCYPSSKLQYNTQRDEMILVWQDTL